MTEKSPTPPSRRVQAQAHTINPVPSQLLYTTAQTTAVSPPRRERAGLVAAGGWAEAVQIVADPAVAIAVAGGSAAVVNRVLKETGATVRQAMAEKTNRQAGAPSTGPVHPDGGQS